MTNSQIRSKFTVVAILVMMLVMSFAAVNVNAGADVTVERGTEFGLCTFIGPICNALNIQPNSGGQAAAGQALDFATTRISQIVSLIFIGIIVISIFIIIQAGIKYIQSNGEEGKIAESQKAIKSVFMGIAILFVGIIGLILVVAFFNGTGLLDSTLSPDELFNTDGTSTNNGGADSKTERCLQCMRDNNDDLSKCAVCDGLQ